MAFWEARDFLFCGLCGTLLTFDSVRSASCPRCGSKRMAKEIEGKKTQYTVTAEDIRRELMLEPFVDTGLMKADLSVERPTIPGLNCIYCDKPRVTYSASQMRGADEGQTALYECKDCGRKWNENS